jgi:hypothetical protein
MGIRDIIERFKSKREKFKAFAEDQKIVETFEERKKSSNERELERFMKEERENQIKHELERFRKNRDFKDKHSHKILETKNMFKKEKKVILGTPNMFSDVDNEFSTQKRLFFK